MKKFVFFILFISFVCTAFCQYPEIHYERISDQQGLNEHWIECLLQDSMGFVWIGGENGLSRYDGYNFVYYRDPPGCKNCPHFYPVCDVVEDNEGILWTISPKGITLYDPEKERSCMVYRFRSASIAGNSYSYKKDLDLMKDSHGNIWATHELGLIRFSYKQQGNTKEVTFDKGPESTLDICYFNLSRDTISRKNRALKIYEDLEGNIWAGCAEGLDILRKGDSSFFRLDIKAEKKSTALFYYIRDILQQNRDTFLILSDTSYLMTNVKEALHGIVPDGSLLRFRKFIVAKEQTPSVLYKDIRNQIFIATDFDVFRVRSENAKNGLIFESLYKKMHDNKDYLTVKYNCSLLEDRAGTLWIGDRNFGLMKFSQDRSPFISYNDMEGNIMKGFNICPINSDNKGNLWLGDYGSGLYRFQKETNQMTRYDLGFPGNNIVTMEEIIPGILWIGTNTGVIEFNTLTGKFHNPLLEGGIAINWNVLVTGILKDLDQMYLTSNVGLFVYDLTKKRLIQYSYPENNTIHHRNDYTGAPVKLKSGEIIIATNFHGILKVKNNEETVNLSTTCILADSVLRSRNINLTNRFKLY
jgi:ligand-binding sensor domain-containing protein